MPTFHYQAKADARTTRRGHLDAADVSAAVGQLEAMGLIPVTVVEDRPGREGAAGRRVTARDIGVFTRQMVDLLEAGLPLPQALASAARQTPNPRLGGQLKSALDRLERGASLADALEAQGGVFPEIYIGLVRAGEAGAFLPTALGRLADDYEREEELSSRIKTALAYPTLVLIAGFGASVFLVMYVVPQLAGVFEEMGQPLPWVTRGLIALGRAASSPAAWVVGAGCLAVIAWIGQKYRTRVRERIGDALERLPGLREWIHQAATARFARTLSTLLSGGIPILEGLRMAAEVGGSRRFRARVMEARRRVSRGAGLAAGLEAAGFPVEWVRVAAVGEESRDLGRALDKIAVTLERRRDRAFKVFTALLEPALILLVGGVIAVIVLGMLLPVFGLSTVVS